MLEKVRDDGSLMIPERYVTRYGLVPGKRVFFTDTGRGIEIQTEAPPTTILDNLHVVGGLGTSYRWDCVVYLLHSVDESVLIDCGTTRGFEQIQRNIRSLGYNPNKISRILLTHCHYDHADGAHLWKKHTAADVFINALGQEPVETGDKLRTAACMFGEGFHAFSVDGTLTSGDTIEVGDIRLKVVDLPGHTPDNTGFYGTIDNRTVCFTGDPCGAFSQRWGSSVHEELATVHRLMSLDIDILCHGHRYFLKELVPPLLQRWKHLCEDDVFAYFLARKHQT